MKVPFHTKVHCSTFFSNMQEVCQKIINFVIFNKKACFGGRILFILAFFYFPLEKAVTLCYTYVILTE